MAWRDLSKKEKANVIADLWTLIITGAIGFAIAVILSVLGVIDVFFSFDSRLH